MENINFKKKSLVASIVIASSAILYGCANKPSEYDAYNRTGTKVNSDHVKDVNKIIDESDKFSLGKPEFGKINDDFYVNKTPVDSIDGNKLKSLPIEFSRNVSFYTKSVKLKDFLAEIEAEAGVQIVMPYKFLEDFTGTAYNGFEEEVIKRMTIDGGLAAFTETEEPQFDEEFPEQGVVPVVEGEPDSDRVLTPPERGGLDRSGVKGLVNKVVTPEIKYEGSLKGLLDNLSSIYGLNWKYDADIQKVLFFKYDTKVFYVYSSKKKVDSSTTISTNSKSGADGEAGNIQSSTSSDIKIDDESDSWSELVSTVESIVGDEGEVSFMKQQRKIIVTAKDEVLSHVAGVINGVNDDATTQVVMKVDIKNLIVNSNENINVNLQYINDNLTGKLADITGLSSFSLIKNGLPSGENVTFGASSDNKTDITGDVLSTFGTTRNAFSKSFITKNNQTFPVQMVNNERYISEVSVTVDNETTTTDVETDDIMDGITINVTPSVIGNRIEVELTGAISSNDGIVEREIGGGDSSVALGLPREGKKNIHQEVILSNGVPKVVSVLKKDYSTAEKSGPFSPFAWFLGGSTSKSEKDEYIIITVTAYINR